MSDGISSRINKTLSKQQLELFRNLINSIELRDLITQKAVYERFELDLGKKENKIEFRNSQKVETTDPVILKNGDVQFNPAYKIDILINETIAMSLFYHYGLVFQILDKETFDTVIKDEDVKQFFLSKQLPRITWSFLREEIYSAMNKCGIRSITLPMMK